MKRIIFICLLFLLIPLTSWGALSTSIDTRTTWQNAYRFTGSGGDFMLDWCIEMEDLVDDFDGDIWTSSTYSGTFGQSANNVFKWTETPSDLEDLLLTFGSNTVTWSTGSSVVWSFGTMAPNMDSADIDSHLYLNPIGTPPATTEGHLYANTDHQLYYYDGSGWRDLTAGASGITDLDTAYDGGATIDADSGSVIISNDDADANPLLSIAHTGAAAGDGLLITVSGGSSDAIEIENTGTGYDIEGTAAVWYVDVDGSIVAPDIDLTGAAGITLQNDGTITNAVDTAFLFTDGGESLSLTLASDTVTLGTGTSVATLEFGVVDALTGIDEVAFDVATTSTITKASAAHADFTVSMSGAVDASLILSSTGTGDDALQITTSAGGIDITGAGTAGGTADVDIDSTTASLNLNADEDVADALTIVATAGGIDITADGASASDLDLACTNGSVNITAGESGADSFVITSEIGGIDILAAGAGDGEDIDIIATGSSVNITATQNGIASIYLHANGGAAETIKIHADQTTADAGIDIDSDTGGITVDAALSIVIASSESTADAIKLNASAGGIQIYAPSAADTEDIDIKATGSSIFLESTQAVGNAIVLNASDGAGGIDVDCGSGGINIDASAGAFTVIGEAASTIYVTAGANTEDLTLQVTGAFEASLHLSNTGGTTADAITMQATGTGGGIDIDATAGGTINVLATDDLTLAVTGGTNGEDILITNTTTAECSITLENTGGTVADAISLNASGSGGGILIDTDNGKIDLDTDGAANGDIDIDAADQILISSDDADGTDSILITTTTGASSNLKIYNTAGTGAAALELVTGAGGITLTSTGASDGDMFLTVGDDILIDAAGAVDITSNTAGTAGDITLDSESASVIIDAAEDITDAINIVCTGSSGGIDITSLADIDITTTGALGEDITLDNQGGSIHLIATEAVSDAINIDSSGGVDIDAVTGSVYTASAVADGAKGITLSGSIAGVTASEGLGLYVEGNTSGNADGKVYALGAWLNITAGSPTDGPDSLMAAGDFGIYAAAAPELSTTQLRVINLEYQVHTDAAPLEEGVMMHFNCDTGGDTPDYWFSTGNAQAVAYEADVTYTSPNKVGAIKIEIGGVGAMYLWTYSDAGS